MNIINRSYLELLKPLDYVQAAPIGFLWLEKFFSNLLGINEYALRFFSLIVGILSIFLYYLILKEFNDYKTRIFALGFFVFNDHLIYFSSEVKPYSGDVLFSLLLLLLALKLIKNNLKSSTFIFFGFSGVILLWFSFPAVFVFTGIGLILVYIVIKNRDYKLSGILLIIGGLWILSLILNYSICLRHYTSHNELIDFWQKNFIPFPPKTLSQLYQISYILIRVLKNPGGFSIYGIILALCFFLIGFVTLYNMRRVYSLLFILPVIVTILASIFRLYPFEGRVILFIAPILIIFVSAGISRVHEIVKKESQVIAILLSLILFIPTAGTAIYHLIKPRAPEESRPALEYIKKNKQKGDIIYVYYGARNAFEYYRLRFPELNKDYIYGIESRNDWTKYYSDIERLKGNKRVWFVFSHIATHLGVDEEKLFITYLNLLGRSIEDYKTSGASVYLYDLSR